MAWVKIDDQYYAHPKVIAAGPLGKTLFVDALCYANQYLTDGFIPRMVALQLAMPIAPFCSADEVITSLIGANLWHDADGGYQIHDYLDYNPSRESVLAQRKAAKDRMQRARSANNDRSPDVRANFAGTSPEVQKCSPNPVPDPVPVVPTEQDSPPLSPQGEKQAPEPKAKTPRKQPETFVPESFPLEAKHLEYAGKKGLTKTEAERETEKFLLWHGAKQSRHVDWYKAWQGWILRASENKAKLTPFQKPDEEIPGHESWRNRKAVLA